MFHCLELTSGKGNLISFFQACSMNDQTQFTCLGFGLSFAIITQTCKLILNVYFSCEFCLLVFLLLFGFPNGSFLFWSGCVFLITLGKFTLACVFPMKAKTNPKTLKHGRSWDLGIITAINWGLAALDRK